MDSRAMLMMAIAFYVTAGIVAWLTCEPPPKVELLTPIFNKTIESQKVVES